jgi:hypothetical protein
MITKTLAGQVFVQSMAIFVFITIQRVQIKKDGHAASDTGALKVATGNSFGVIPEVKIL